MKKSVNKVTSPKVAKIAAKLLKSPETPKKIRAPIASDLAQAVGKKKKTS